jgi:DNA repair protein RadC
MTDEKAPSPPSQPGRIGHRDRLRHRFLDAGPAALADYEMLELLLFQAIPRRDTKPVARALIDRFGSYAVLLRADVAALPEIKWIGVSGAVMLRAVADAAERLARQGVIDQPVLSSWDELLGYLRISLIHHDTERFRILFLNVKNRLIGDEEQQRGTV